MKALKPFLVFIPFFLCSSLLQANTSSHIVAKCFFESDETPKLKVEITSVYTNDDFFDYSYAPNKGHLKVTIGTELYEEVVPDVVLYGYSDDVYAWLIPASGQLSQTIRRLTLFNFDDTIQFLSERSSISGDINRGLIATHSHNGNTRVMFDGAECTYTPTNL